MYAPFETPSSDLYEVLEDDDFGSLPDELQAVWDALKGQPTILMAYVNGSEAGSTTPLFELLGGSKIDTADL